MEREERLDPDYFRITPKSSWELFGWIFTEPIKLEKFSDTLSSKEVIAYFFRTSVWVIIFAYIVFEFIFYNEVDTRLNSNNLFSEIFLSHGNALINFIIFTIVNLIIFGFFFKKDLSSRIRIFFSLMISISITIFFKSISYKLFFSIFILTLIFIKYKHKISLVQSILLFPFPFLFFSSIFHFMIAFFFSTDSDEPYSYQIESEHMGIAFMWLTTFIGLIIICWWICILLNYLLALLEENNDLHNSSLQNNIYLQTSYVIFSFFILHKKLAKESFKKPNLSLEFINFLFEFRPHQRKLAFYLFNVVNASKFYNNKLASNGIKIPKEYEKHQPIQSFITTLQKLKNKLGSYQTEINIHDKVDSLQKIIEILKDLEQQMIIEQRGWSEYYLKAIRANLNEANARLKNLELEAKNREPITPNIYEIGNPLSPNYQNKLFKGRTEVVDRLSNIIYTSQQMPLLLIQGQRRVGKTSLINYLEQLLGSGFKIVKLDMQSATNKEFGSLVKNINQELNSMLGIDETIETSDNIMQSWIAFEEYLTKHTKALNYKIIIAFDEYESFHEYIVQKRGKIVLENMRSFIQSQNQVIFLFAGMLRISDLTSPNWDEYFPQAQRLKVDYLSQDESFELITHPVDGFNLVYSDEVADEVYRWTMGHPQLLQTICSNIVTIANQTNQKRVTFEMVEKAKDEVFEVNEMPMTIFWREFCGNEERESIEQILAKRTIIRETKEQKRALARLVDYGFITKEFEIFVPLFEKWLIERRDLIKIP